MRSLDCICQMQIQLGEPASAVETSIEAVALDPYRELTQINLMQAYAAAGNRAKAVDVYHRFSKLLACDLGSDPSLDIEALYLKLLG